MRHPFERLSLPRIRVACLTLLLLRALLTVVLFAAVPLDHAHELLRFLHANDASEAAGIVATWPPGVRATARFLIGVDFLYDAVHNNAVALLCMWAALRLGSYGFNVTARIVAWVMWFDTLCNLVENFSALHIVGGGSVTPWFGIVVASTAFRFATLWLGFALGVVGLGFAYRNARQTGARAAT